MIIFLITTQKQDYYIGILVTYKRQIDNNIFYETIDGQQRLTTFTLLTSVIKNFYLSVPWFKKVNLEFASRKSSSDTFKFIYQNGKNYDPNYLWNQSLIVGYKLCKKILEEKLKENEISIKAFADYLFKWVKIIRVTVPEDTELNHYFEIMNNRGEQLEKHEILKSRFLELLHGLESSEKELALSVFNQVWEACSNMEKYIQYGFSVQQRDTLFGREDWNTLQPSNFSELTQKLKETFQAKELEPVKLSLIEIIQGKVLKSSEVQNEELPERFNAVINFPNFLLHVLRIYTGKDIPLDDKRLITSFDAEINAADDKIQFAQEFSFELLKCKFLFDKYIIKREFVGGKDRWSLKKLKCYKDNNVNYVETFGDSQTDDSNRTILMLLSMFHVSTPTLVYKHWLNAALLYVRKNDLVDAEAYKNYLLAISRSFVFDRFLSTSKPKNYFDIIYRTTETVRREREQLNLKKLVFEQGIENIIFNYLDFLLWEKHKDENGEIGNFEFTFRSSVEHYYPQKPMSGYTPLDENTLNSFGNLCLISHSENSRLSNLPPIAKRSHYYKQSPGSIKQWLMMRYNPDEWNEESINKHGEEMIKVLTEHLDSEFN